MLLENRLLYIDLKHLAFDTITLARRDNCPVCGPHPTDSPRPVQDKTVEETCARDGRRVVVISPKEIKQIDPRKLRRVIESKGMKVDVVSHFGITFGNIQDVRMSVLRTGVLIAQIPPKSIFSRDDINKIYQSVVESAS